VDVILKSIELFGFKSFAERTQINIQEGISAILGPNGCGKSNILDAIKWVLGEQSTKKLRANKMEDIIFSGTEQRKALNVAEVSLILCNYDNLFPIEMSEISIKRRIYRSGENEYFVNSTPVKLKEVRELFFDTGIGKSAYSIMEQGKIDQLLSNKPGERRYIFDEAAGINAYKIKRTEAERKLEKTEENIRQIAGILGEVKRSYDTLKKQSEKTEKYRAINEEIFNVELTTQLIKLKVFLEDKEKREKDLSGNNSSRDVIKSDIDQINQLLEDNINLVNSMESNLIEIQKQLYGMDIEINNKKAQIQILNERIAELERKIQFDETRKMSIREKILRLTRDQEDKKAAYKELITEINDIEKNIKGFKHDIDLYTIRIKDNKDNIYNIQQTNIKREEDLENLRNELRVITDDIVTQMDQRLKHIGYSSQERKKREDLLEEIIDFIRIQIQGKSSLIEDAQRLGELNKDIISSLITTFNKVISKLGEFVKIFSVYKKSTPAFIDEFLAPQGIITKKRIIDEKISNTIKAITMARKKSEELTQENNALSKNIDEYRNTLGDLRVNRATIYTRKTAIADDNSRLAQEIGEQQILDSENIKEIEQTKTLIDNISENIKTLKQEKNDIENQEKLFKQKLNKLEQEITNKNHFLLTKERLLKQRMGSLEKVQVKVEKLQMILAEINAEIRNTYENFKEKYSRDLTDYQSKMYEINKPISELKAEVKELKDKIKELGQINLMAPEEFAEVKERYEFLQNQLEDLKKAQVDLQQITERIRNESSLRFSNTYNIIKKNFNNIFRRLFGGGRAELKLTLQEQILESGIEILAQPPGKKLENIVLLSGGERALTAIALLFAIYMVKPAPFCILDEIDAALDDNNISKFVHMLQEFSQKSQFLIITHNKKTITRAKSLIGITMEESGVSKLITLKLKNHQDNKVYV